MTPASLLAQLRANGITVTAEPHGKLHLEGADAAVLSPELEADLRRHRGKLRALLAQEAQPRLTIRRRGVPKRAAAFPLRATGTPARTLEPPAAEGAPASDPGEPDEAGSWGGLAVLFVALIIVLALVASAARSRP